jgi:uncharacterized protein YdeI (YjbR/CyaY-like superfamily)
VNTRRVPQLVREQRMHPAGLRAFEARDPTKTAYTYERRTNPELAASEKKKFKSNAKAWRFFESQPPGYRRLMIFRVVDAKRDETRARRL